jgi:GH35 family endo-1,4-beta-xylanase
MYPIQKFTILLLIILCLLSINSPAGIIYNEDDTHRFMLAPAGQLTEQHLHQYVDSLADTQVEVLSICVCAKRTNYDSHAWEPYWDGFDPDKDNTQPWFGDLPEQDRPAYRQWGENMYTLFKAGVDPNRSMIERCRQQRISPWISIRMNDVHDAQLARSPLHSKFWMEHPQYWRFPDRINAWNDRCLDYGQAAVRDHAMALIREVLERYDLDGLELDWNRFPLHFREGEELEQGEVLTGWMEAVRAEVRKAERKHQHQIHLIARVPARPEVSKGTGLDAVTWAKRKLIDHLIVAPFWATTDFDIPLEEWQWLLVGTGVRLTGGIEALVRPHPGHKPFEHVIDTLRGAASGLLARGSEGVYCFNLFEVPKASNYLLQELDSLPILRKQNRSYLVTYPDISIPNKPIPPELPRTIQPSESAEFQLYLVSSSSPTDAVVGIGTVNGRIAETTVEVCLENRHGEPKPEKMQYEILDVVKKDGYYPVKITNHRATPLEIHSVMVDLRPRLTEKEILQTVDERIERFRKGNATIHVVDPDGKPVPGVRVKIEQTHHQFLFGCNNYLSGQLKEATEEALLRDRFSTLFNYATLPFYWFSYEPSPGQTRAEDIRKTAAWCLERGIRLKGHPLAWNFCDPAWLPEATSEVKALQLKRIEDLVKEYAGTIDTWDVVNEPTHYDREEFLKQSPKISAVMKSMGSIEFIKECFRLARQTNPKATLLINDYRFDEEYAKVIQQLTDPHGKPIYDKIGIQSHMHGEGVWSVTGTWNVLERYARFGVPLHFTETTILSGKLGYDLAKKEGSWHSTPTGEKFQVEAVDKFYRILFSHPSVEAITWWDVSDRNAWMEAPAGLLDKNLNPKPAYLQLEKLIKNRWWTRRILRTQPDGSAAFRGFLGDYQITVELPNGDQLTRDFSLTRNTLNDLVVTIPESRLKKSVSKGSVHKSRPRLDPWSSGFNPAARHGKFPGWAEYRRGRRE